MTIKKDVVVNTKPRAKEDMSAKINSFSPGKLKLIPTLKLKTTLVIKKSKFILIKTQNPGGISFIVPVDSRSSNSFIVIKPYGVSSNIPNVKVLTVPLVALPVKLSVAPTISLNCETRASLICIILYLLGYWPFCLYNDVRCYFTAVPLTI